MKLNTLDSSGSLSLEPLSADGNSARQEIFGAITFLVGLPLLFGFLIGWFRGGSAKYLSMPLSVAFWVSGFFITWWCMEVCSRVVSRLAGRWLPLAATLLTGAVLGLMLAGPGLALRLEIFRPHFGGWLPDYAAPPPGGLSWLDWVRFATPILLVWMTSNWVYFVLLAKRRFGRTAAFERAFWLGSPSHLEASSPTSLTQSPAAIPIEPAATEVAAPPTVEEPATIASLGLSVRDVVALEADDHYTRVFHRQGSRYLRAQFGHLLQQMPPTSGLQISRSTWVSLDAIEKVTRAGRGLTVQLVNGQSMHVTRGYKVAFERAYR